MTDQEPWTIKRLLEWTAPYLKRSGAASPRLDAEVLLAKALGCQRIDLYVSFDKIPSPPQLTGFRENIKKRAAGVPVAYLVGEKEFFSLTFEVTPAVLIPRPETEYVVLRALELAKTFSDKPLRVADVGTGSGILAVTLAKHLKQASLLAIDIEPAALEIARNNAKRHGVDNRIFFQEGDLFSATDSDQKFDLIVSNPPYVGTAESGTVEPSVAANEPYRALFAGEKGDEVIKRLIPQAADRLETSGSLIFEASPLVMGRCEELFQQEPRFGPTKITNDQNGLARVIEARKTD